MEDAEEEDAVVLSLASDLSDSSVEFVDDDDENFSIVDNLKCNDHGPIVAEYVSSEDDSKPQNLNCRSVNSVVSPQPLARRVISASDGISVARKPFKPPFLKGSNDCRDQLHQRLSLRRRFVPWGFTTPFKISLNSLNPTSDKKDEKEDVALPRGIEPLVLWQRGCNDGSAELTPIIMVDSLLVRFLRPHQREGVRFMFECVSGLHSAANIFGCILADDMGLGKTLQSITLLYTLLRQGFDGKPLVKKAIIVTPTSLVSNWAAEIKKWVGDRIRLSALCEGSREDVISAIDCFTNPWSKTQVLIISYETFRMHCSKFSQKGSCDLLICDEAHRLKNDRTRTNRALASLLCKRRILLSGTPMQNDLEEFYAMVNFTNPGILGDASHFRRYYEMPIVRGREPTATEEEKRLGLERSEELSSKVNQFILRRTNALLSNHLPPKMVEVVCCKLTPVQSELYDHFIQSKNVKRVITDDAKQSKILAYITALKKLCNHPKLVYDTIKDGSSGISGFEDCLRLFPSKFFSPRSGSWTGADGVWVELSGKMNVLARLLSELRQKTDDRIVLVSNYTQTLDLFAQLCRERRYPYLKLDGTTSISKRQELVNRFNDPSKDEFAFLLSSKAGGCGLNLIGGNRLVLFDPDWNPANDKQAAARVWRDGQKKRVYVYRFLSTGTIEEKMYQRQMSKEGLQKVIQQEQTVCDKGNFFSIEDLRDLFSYRADVRSEIHDKMNCIRCRKKYSTKSDRCESTIELNRVESVGETCQTSQDADIGGFAEISGCLHKLKGSERQVGTPLEEDLLNWAHHSSHTSVPDVVFQASAGNEVTFVFTNQIEGKLIPIESMSPKMQDVQGTSTFSGLNQPNSRKNQNWKSMMASVASSKAVRAKPIRSSLRDMTNSSWKPRQSPNGQLPSKRSFPCIEGE